MDVYAYLEKETLVLLLNNSEQESDSMVTASNISNQLMDEKSPYLLQHANNPVNWYPWGDEAFTKAAKEDKPIFLSIGYSTCHWCHVMAHESFEDTEIAAQLNKEFVCIKVDREERPDIDAVYMTVCQAMTGSGGWPLTIIMTPQQQPFFAGTYFPKRSQYGQPGLTDILTTVSRLWQQDRSDLLHRGQQITAEVQKISITAEKEPSKDLLHKAYQMYLRQFDKEWGGFGNAPKFPAAHNLLFLMAYSTAERQPEGIDMVQQTLQAIAKGGIHDHIGGGFSRYATDRHWLVPHFEKMLYDNALLLLAYLQLYQLTGQEQYVAISMQTADYILRELTDDLGGFYCGQDADSDGIEGKYYVWTPQEVMDVLGQQDGQAFNALYRITDKGNFEGRSIPNRIGQSGPGWPVDDVRLKQLYTYRQQRVALHKDDKVLLAWNSWAIIALARAGQILEDDRYLQAAIKGQQFAETYMVGKQNRLYVRWRDGEAAHAGQLDDYAMYGLALLELYRVTFQPMYLQQAMLRAEQMIALFEDKAQGGYFLTAHDAERLIVRPKEIYDGAMPSGNSAAAMLLQHLATLSDKPQWKQAAWRQLCFLAGAAEQYPIGHSFALLAMLEGLYPHKELVCVTGQTVPQELKRYLQANPGHGLSILLKTKENAATLAACAPFTADYPIPEQGAAYYLCEQGACKKPMSDFAALSL